jgi:ATP-dependent Clp protease protease subunit
MGAAPGSDLPPDVYAVFCGSIDQNTAQIISHSLLGAIQRQAKHIHLALQSSGGFVGDGIFLYNLFRAASIEMTLYNIGQISSIGVIAYLGAKNRRTTANASFMVHRSVSSPQFSTTSKLAHAARILSVDDQRTDSILKKHTKLPLELWTELDHHDVYLSGKEAVQFGLANEIAEFSPPLGTQLFNILQQ